MPLQIPAELKKITPYIRRAEELDKDKTNAESRLVAYYCRQYAVHTGIALATSDEGKNCLGDILASLEGEKAAMDSFTLDEAKFLCEAFANKIFEKADSEDREGGATRNTAKTFYAAASFLEILQQFYQEEDESEENQEVKKRSVYAKWKATDILKAIKEGRDPTPGGYGEAEEEEEKEEVNDAPGEVPQPDVEPIVRMPSPPPSPSPPTDDENDGEKDVVEPPPPYSAPSELPPPAYSAPAAPAPSPPRPPIMGRPAPIPPPMFASVPLPSKCSKFSEGQFVNYKSNHQTEKAEILKVHLDDELVAFYTIRLTESGREKQTDDAHLEDFNDAAKSVPTPPAAPATTSRGIFGSNRGAKKKATKAQLADARELTQFALAALEDKNTDLAAERLAQALQTLGR